MGMYGESHTAMHMHTSHNVSLAVPSRADVSVCSDLLEGRVCSFFLYKPRHLAHRCFIDVNQMGRRACVSVSL